MDKNIINKVIAVFVVYSLILLFIGRNLSFIPIISLKKSEQGGPDNLKKNVIEKFLKGENGTYSVYYKNLKTGEEFGVDENKVVTAASLNKVLIVSYLYSLAKDGKIDLEDKITIQEKDIQDYGTGSIRYGGAGKSYSIKQLVKLALEQSDNTAAYVLGVRLGEDKIQAYGKSLGLSATDISNNKTTALEMGRMLEAIWIKKVTSDVLTRELLDFMKDTDFEDRIPRDLPDTVSVYHKAADAVTMVHDAGIVDNPARDGENGKTFILTIITTDIVNEEEAKKNMGKLAKFIYEHE